MRFPSPLETERLILRTPTVDDAGAVNRAIHETWEQLTVWMPWAKERPTLQDSIDTCTRMSQNTLEGRDFALMAFEKATGEFVMGTGCHPRNLEVPSFEIGYWCRASMQGRGYVTEAVHAITEAAFSVMGACRVEIRCDDRNIASRAVAERCGFLLEGTFRHDCRDNAGELRTTLIFAQVRQC